MNIWEDTGNRTDDYWQHVISHQLIISRQWGAKFNIHGWPIWGSPGVLHAPSQGIRLSEGLAQFSPDLL